MVYLFENANFHREARVVGLSKVMINFRKYICRLFVIPDR